VGGGKTFAISLPLRKRGKTRNLDIDREKKVVKHSGLLTVLAAARPKLNRKPKPKPKTQTNRFPVAFAAAL